MVRQLRLEGSPELAGVMNRDAFFRQVDLLVLCSRIENLPYVILRSTAVDQARLRIADRLGSVTLD